LLQDEEDQLGLRAGGADTVLQPRRAHHAVIKLCLLSFATAAGSRMLLLMIIMGMAKENNALRAHRDIQ
jgi:hypothetical protein